MVLCCTCSQSKNGRVVAGKEGLGCGRDAWDTVSLLDYFTNNPDTLATVTTNTDRIFTSSKYCCDAN